MKLATQTALAAVLSLVFAVPVAVFAQAPAAPAPGPPTAAPAAANRASGAVTAVNAAAGTLTVHDRRSDTDVAVAVTPDTKYTKEVRSDIASVTVGNFIAVQSREELAAGATSIDAYRILVIPELPTENRPNAHAVIGTVATITPTFTVKAVDGTTVTVNTTAETQVLTSQAATVADITVGQNVQVQGKSDGTTLTARSVTIVPARRPAPAN